ncbi:universal stress protein [Tsukamurella soli]
MTNQAITPYILAGVDGSPAALHAVGWAADEARKRGLPLLLANVIETSGTEYGPAFGVSNSVYASMEKWGREVLAAAEERVTTNYPSVRMSTIQKTGAPAAELITLSRDAHLTVVGANGLGGFSSVLLGTVASAMVTDGHSPVAVIRRAGKAENIPTTGPVVLGVDGNEDGETAIAWAFDEACRRGATLTAVHVWTAYPTGAAHVYAVAAGVDTRAEEEEHRELLAERLAGWQEKYPDVAVRRVIAAGKATDVLLEHTADAQLVVVGSRGHGEMTGILFGSVSRALIHHAPCPVLVARERGRN